MVSLFVACAAVMSWTISVVVKTSCNKTKTETKAQVPSPRPQNNGVHGILVRGVNPFCRPRRRKLRKFDYEMVHSEVYLNKYAVSIVPSQLFIACFRFNFSSIFQGVTWPHLPLCADAHAAEFRSRAVLRPRPRSRGLQDFRELVMKDCQDFTEQSLNVVLNFLILRLKVAVYLDIDTWLIAGPCRLTINH